MLSIVLGFLGYSVLNVSQAIQKIGLLTAQTKKLKGILLWLLATGGTLAASFLVFAAVALGNASLVGAMAGAGLASLAVFSHFVMKERIGPKEVGGVIVIVAAAGLIGLFSQENRSALIRLEMLFVMLGTAVLLAVLACLVFRKRTGVLGIVIGVFSGSLGGFIPLFQKVAASALGASLSLFPVPPGAEDDPLLSIIAMFSNPFTLVWILLSLASMLILQFAYKKAAVIKIIPFFSAVCIVIPVLGGVVCLGEVLHPLQWAGVVFILGGLVLLTVKGGRPSA